MSDFQYPPSVAPILTPLPADAPQTVDRWLPRFPDRVHRIALPVAAYLVVSAQNILPIPPVASPSGGGTIPTGSYTLWQYQELAAPFIPDQTVLALNWQPTYPDAIRTPKGLGTASQRPYVADKFDPPSAPTVPDWGWASTQPDQARGRAPNAYRAPFFAMDTQWTAPPQNVSTTLWMPKGAELPVRAIFSRAAYTWAQPHFVVQISVPVMSWTGWYLDPPVRRPSSRASVGNQITAPLYLADVTTTAPPLSWDGVFPDQALGYIKSVGSRNARSVAPLYIADVTNPAPTLSARAVFPDRIQAKMSLGVGNQKSWVMDAIYGAPTPATAPALAKPVYPDRVPAKKQPPIHPDMRAPEYVLDVTVPAPAMSWSPRYPDRPVVTVRQPQRQVLFYERAVPTTTFNPYWATNSNVLLNPLESLSRRTTTMSGWSQDGWIQNGFSQ